MKLSKKEKQKIQDQCELCLAPIDQTEKINILYAFGYIPMEACRDCFDKEHLDYTQKMTNINSFWDRKNKINQDVLSRSNFIK